MKISTDLQDSSKVLIYNPLENSSTHEVTVPRRTWLGCLALVLIFCAGINVNAAPTAFSFALDEPCKTSAGVYQTNGTLVRTLWCKSRFYAAGTYSSNWDGLDDHSNAAAPGVYQIRMLQHNMEYVWDGALGNTSAQKSGPTVHSAFYTMHDLTISGTNAFYVTGYNEAQYDYVNFCTTNPQIVISKWCDNAGTSDSLDRNWNCACSDSNWVYFTAPVSYNPTNSNTANYPGFVIATQIGAPSVSTFSNGIGITNVGENYPNGVYIGTQPGLSGISVQMNSNLLAASVAPDNAVYLLDKHSGAALRSFTVADPGRLSFSPDGSLWVISGNNIIHFTNLTSTPLAALTIPGFSKPLAIAVSPTNLNLVLVADGGASQQVKAFNGAGTPLWTYGLTGGYQTNGPAVTTNKFYFRYDIELVDGTLLTFAPDGSFWVGDGGNHRVLHFSSSANYLEQIMYQPVSYETCVDQNNVSRVFNQFLEFHVDYTKPLSQAWTLVNNWMANADTNHLSDSEGIYNVTTLTNGRTYGLIHNNAANKSEVIELATNGLRFTGIMPLSCSTNRWTSLGSDGSAQAVPCNSATWYGATLAGFDTNNNPLWNPLYTLACAPLGSTNPAARCCSPGNLRTTVSTNNILITFDQSLNNGFHLGGIRLGGTNWLWQASPAVAFTDGTGNYEISNGVAYGGNTLQALDRDIIYGYHGEFFRGEGQAAQHMHFYDDGLFLGQFGEPSPGHSAYEGALPGFAGNAHCPCLVEPDAGDYYVWDNDESQHGPQRWHLVNARNIRELTGSGTLGGTITLTNPVVSFPTRVTVQPGNMSATLSWLSVAGAASYKVYYSFLNGGPFLKLAGETPATNCVIAGLTNGQTYYFAATAIRAGTESIPSEQVAATPFNPSQKVQCAGSLTEGGQWTPVIDVNPGGPTNGFPAYVGNEHLAGVLGLDDLCNYGFGSLMDENIGTEGYALFDWGGNGSNIVNLLPSFTVTVGPGWQNMPYIQRQFRVAGALGTNYGLSANPVGSITIGVTDTNFHFLTVISPAVFNNARIFTMTLTTTNQASAIYTVNENPGLSHTFQFLFQGSATLTASATGGALAIVQGLFLDAVPGGNSRIPEAPSGLRIQSSGTP